MKYGNETLMNDRKELIQQINDIQFQSTNKMGEPRMYRLGDYIDAEIPAIADFITEQIRLARIDELEMAIHMRGKSLFGGVLIDSSNIEGGNPDAVSSKIIETRLASLKAQLAPKPEKDQL